MFQKILTAYKTLACYCQWCFLELRKHLPTNRQVNPTPNTALLIAWDLPPRFSSGTFRPHSFIKFCEQEMWTVDSFSGPIDVKTDADNRSVSTHRRGQSLHYNPPRFVPSFRIFPKIHGGFYTAISAVFQLKPLLTKRKYCAIIASGPPFCVFVIGYFSSRLNDCPLILDYRDEWTENPFIVANNKFDRWWERRCIRAADMIVFTTESQKKHQLKIFHELSPDKTIVLPNGWDPSVDVQRFDLVGPKTVLDRPLVVSYIGKLGSHVPIGRFLSTLNSAMESANQDTLRPIIRFVGEIDEIARSQVEATAGDIEIEEIGVVDHETAINIAANSDLLLLIADKRLERYRPGKLYDYLASRRPILVFGEAGEISEVVEQLDAGILIPFGDSDRLAAVIGGREILPDPASNPALKPWLDRHSRETITHTLIEALATLSTNVPEND